MRKSEVLIATLLLAVGLAANVAVAGERIDVSDLADGEVRTYGEGERRVTAVRDGQTVTIRLGGEHESKVFVVGVDGETPESVRVTKLVELSGGPDVSVVECPEGDTTMRLGEDDSGPYFCPKHGLELEKVDRMHGEREIRVFVDSAD